MKKFLFPCLAWTFASAVGVPCALASHRKPHVPRRTQRAIQKTASIHLAGKVLLPDGTPGKNAEVTVGWMTQNGKFLFSTIPVNASGNFDSVQKLSESQPNFMAILSAYIPGKGWAVYQGPNRDPHFKKATLRIQPGTTLTGHIVHSDGRPAANTEIHVEAVFPGGANSNIIEFAEQSFDGVRGQVEAGNAIGQATPYDSMMRLLPDGTMPKLFHTRTDNEGRFAIAGLPHASSLVLRSNGPVHLTPNSMKPVVLDAPNKQDAGILVLEGTGAAKIHVVDSLTHKPAASVSGSITASDIGFSGMVLYHGQPPFAVRSEFTTDQNGTADIKKLIPGMYQVNVLGKIQQLKIEEDRCAPTVEYVLRQGPLQGRLLDAAGKPAANVPIMVNTAPISITFNGRRNGTIQDGFLGSPAWENQPVTQTDSDGRFTLPQFLWGRERVIVRATKGLDRAEYKGLVAQIGSALELRLKRNALVTVTGRLVDPHRRPVKNISCQALHWQSTARSTWFASARPVQADSQGRFRVEGLERGESFSLIANGPPVIGSQHVLAQAAQAVVRTAALKTPAVNDFESPRFVTKQEGITQEMGELMVHPSNTPEDVLQSYGVAAQVASTGVFKAPPPSDAARAQTALDQYNHAIQNGDVKTVYALTSHLSPSYAQRLPDFLLRASLGTSAGTAARGEACGALHYAPRSLITSILKHTFSSDGADTPGSAPALLTNGNMVRDNIEAISFPNPGASGSGDSMPIAAKDWAVLTAKLSDTMVMTGILHREGGNWKVVSDATASHIPLAVLAGSLNGMMDLKAADYKKPTPVTPLAQFAAAQAAGTKYLRAWAANRPDTMLKQTSSRSFAFTTDRDQFKNNLERRQDDGVCPLNPENRIALEPIHELSLWDETWLLGLARSRGMVPQTFNGFSGPVTVSSTSGSQDGNNVALLQYTAPTGHFLMALVRENGAWKVLEPALPL